MRSSKAEASKRYLINSSDGATPLERISTNGPEAKVKAVRKLLERIIPDIQSFAKDA